MASKEEKTEAGGTAPPPQPEPSEASAKTEEEAADKKPSATPDETVGASATDAPAQSQGTAPDSEAGATGEHKSKRVYVGNLAWEVTWQDLKDHAKDSGLDAKLANVMTSHDGRSKGCGIIEFNTVADAQQAVLILNDTELRGRQIFVREDREEQRSSGGDAAAAGGGGRPIPPRELTKSKRVYVGNLSWDVAWQDLKDHMREAGEVVHAEIIRDANARSKGCGIVEFASEEDAQNAISTLTDTELKGRMIFIREDRESSAGSQAGGGGGGSSQGGRGLQNTSVYVWNLSPETSWQDLKDHMRKAGNVDSASVLTNAQGESLCCGVVVYQKPQEAIRAIRELQNSELKGNPIYVREDRVQSQGGGRGFSRGSGGRGGAGRGRSGRGSGRGGRGDEPGTQLFVSSLSLETTWRELKDHFRQCGEVAHAEVKTNPQGQSKCFGTVTFSSREEADEAINQLNGSELQGSLLEVRFDQRSR